MSKYKVGDKIEVVEQVAWDKKVGVNIGDIYEVARVYSNGVNVLAQGRNDYGLLNSQIKKVENIEHAYKVGDNVKIIQLLMTDRARGLKIGNVFKVVKLRARGAIDIKVDGFSNYVMLPYQIEKVEEIKNMNKIKVGDKVRVIRATDNDESVGAFSGGIYTVTASLGGGDVKIKVGEIQNLYMTARQVEKVSDIGKAQNREMTFPEMAQKLIDGEFKIDTELVCDTNRYFVGKLPGREGFGLKNNMQSTRVAVDVGLSDFNTTWAVKETPIKEMSVEQIQEELGYKIKITE